MAGQEAENIGKAKTLFERRSGRAFTDEEARQALANLHGYFRVLARIDRRIRQLEAKSEPSERADA